MRSHYGRQERQDFFDKLAIEMSSYELFKVLTDYARAELFTLVDLLDMFSTIKRRGMSRKGPPCRWLPKTDRRNGYKNATSKLLVSIRPIITSESRFLDFHNNALLYWQMTRQSTSLRKRQFSVYTLADSSLYISNIFKNSTPVADLFSYCG